MKDAGHIVNRAVYVAQRSFRKVTRNRGAFPNEDVLVKFLYLALGNMKKK